MFRQSQVGVLGFLLIWIGVPLALGLVAWMITKLLDKILIIGTVNKLLGAAIGFLKFAFLLGCIIVAVDFVREVKHNVEGNPIVKALEAVPSYFFPIKTPLPTSPEGEEAP